MYWFASAIQAVAQTNSQASPLRRVPCPGLILARRGLAPACGAGPVGQVWYCCDAPPKGIRGPSTSRKSRGRGARPVTVQPYCPFGLCHRSRLAGLADLPGADVRGLRLSQTLPGLLPELGLLPGASCYQAELGRGPALIGSDECVRADDSFVTARLGHRMDVNLHAPFRSI